MELNLTTKIPRQKPTKASIEAANGTATIGIIVTLIMSSLMIFFGKTSTIGLAGWIIIVFLVGVFVVSFLQEWIEPIITTRLFIERSFNVYDHTKYAEFYFKNSHRYLIMVNENNIEIYDLKSGNIIANLNEEADAILLSPLNKFLLTQKRILHKGYPNVLTQMWNIRTSSLVFSFISRSADLKGFIFYKNEKIVLYCNNSARINDGYNETSDEDPKLTIWQTETGQIIDKHWFDYESYSDKKELEILIKTYLKSHKELGQLIDYQYPLLDDTDNEKIAIEPYRTKIIFPSCTKTYDGGTQYDLAKLKEYEFTEKATCIIVKIPLKEIKSVNQKVF
ncbi:hypothetical protein [Nostoc sp.]|uniref:hypothetical protein n=1 Tax=Nostoc sp. TaxID=1180 RepID=UPI002FFB3FFF